MAFQTFDVRDEVYSRNVACALTYTSKLLLPYIVGYLQAIYSHVDNQYLVNRDYIANLYKIHYSHIEMYHLTRWCEMVQSKLDKYLSSKK